MATAVPAIQKRRGLHVAFLSLLLWLAFQAPASLARGSAEEFLGAHFSAPALRQPATLWVTGELREQAESLLGHSFAALRVRYWGEGHRTAWILDEIGKELPITIGVVVEGGKILDVRILEYRESRGGEVRYPFFTRQFQGLALASPERDGSYRLSDTIDGISGATLSVNAVRKIATLSLIFHRYTPFAATGSRE